MYLKNIKLAGFKSFVDPTTIPIRSKMNAIVGPNGCGKSNVVDAIRWVIGESSAKQLRGQSMSDVIFNGTTARNAVGQAMVELHFDNSDNRLTGEYAGYTDIVIRREVHRDGQSRYSLNGSSCRRKDILDIFLGTGLGPRSYSIIEQGMISRLIEAKPEEMRAHFEEVAGISKYKERRRETENRIRHTEDNLARLNDIREELIKQLRHLKRQANAAERYQVYKEEERELSSQIKALQWQALQEQNKNSQDQIRAQELKHENQITRQRQYETEIDKLNLAHESAEEEMHSVQKQYYTLGEEVARLESQIKSQQDQLERWRHELESVNAAIEELEENTAEYRDQIDGLEKEVQSLAPQSGQMNAKASEAKNTFLQAEAKMQLWQEAWDDFQEYSSQVSSQAQVAVTKAEHLEKQLTTLAARQQQLEHTGQAIELPPLETEIATLTAQSAAQSDLLDENKTKRCENQEEIANTRETLKSLQEKSKQVRHVLQAQESEHAKLNGLQQAALGRTDQAITPWLKANELLGNRRLGQEIKVNPGWEKAVETVLSGYFDAVCVEEVSQFAAKLADISNGRVTLVDKSALPPADEGKPNTLISQVQCDWPFGHWLSGIYVAETDEQAQAARSSLADTESIITKEGVWYGKNWLRVSRVKDPQSGILAREAKLKSLQTEITEHQQQIDSLQSMQSDAELLLAELEKTRDELQAEYNRLTQTLAKTQAELNKKETQLDALKQQQARIQADLQEVLAQIETVSQDALYAKQSCQELEEQKVELDAKKSDLIHQRDQLRDELEQKRTSAQKEQQYVDELAIRMSANESNLALLRQTLQRDEKQLSQLVKRQEELQLHLHEDNSPLEKLKQSLQQQLQARLSVEKSLHEHKSILGELRHKLSECNQNKQQALEAIESIKAVISQLKLEAQEGIVRAKTIMEQLEQEHLSLEQIIESLPEEAAIKPWEQKLSEVSQRISRLGPINLAAIEEHKDSLERKDYLDKQLADLTESLEVLQAAIAKIDRETKTRFRETFEQVNQGFQKIFPQVFGGGQASLELTENDLLNTGILVKAQPPGKRNASIHMLSGGEKALTAIALVFAMFALNPAPFCILDEVDAPLDDLNVGRFCQLVKEMAKDTQFLTISHNKVTIETADHLLGVTMQEPGVSRLVAVDMQAALDMVEAV